jgi:cellulose synthase/poly-beta-1,6-N-acetylglucosamine synthase-like glycosyltransferase
MTTAFLALAILFGLFFIHPYILYPLSLRLVPRRKIAPEAGSGLPSATLVFCAYNEESSVEAKLKNLREIRALAPDIKFLAYVDLSSDRTLELLRAHPDLVTVVAATERTGKAVGMTRLASQAETEIMIFTDANVMVDPDSVQRLRSYFLDPSIGGVCGTLVYVNAEQSPTAGTGAAYWRLEEFIKKGESRNGSTMGADGSLFATRTAYYPVVPPHLLDDFIVSMSIVFARLRLVSAPDVIAYERGATERRDELRRKRRIACRAYSTHQYIFPQVARLPTMEVYKYFSHRVLRWYSGFTGAAALLFGFLALATINPLVALSLLSICVVAYFVGTRARVPLLSHGAEAVSAIYAATLGVIDAWRGQKYQVWQPAKSR